MQNETSKKTQREAEEILKLTDSAGKNELLFQFGINYNALSDIYRKGSVITREIKAVSETSTKTGQEVTRNRKLITVQHVDIIGNQFWESRPGLISDN